MRLGGVDDATNAITGDVVDAAIEVHSRYGPSLLEGFYQIMLAHALRKRGRKVQTEAPILVEADGLVLNGGYRIDLLVDGVVIVEIKSVKTLLKVHFAQVLTYLKVTGHPVGLLINFNTVPLKQGIHRLVRKDP